MMKQPHLMLQRFWETRADPIQVSPSTEADVTKLEQRYGLKLPSDFRAYLLKSSPQPDNLDEHCTCWWPLDEIKNIPDEYKFEIENEDVAADAKFYLFFADYMVWCWAWAICCKPGRNFGKVVQVGSGEVVVANSFSNFVEAYINGRADLF